MVRYTVSLLLLLSILAFTPAHPLKMCVCAAQYQKDTKKFTLKFRFFWDDLEKVLEKRTGKEIDLQQITPENHRLVTEFVEAYFSIKINDHLIVLQHTHSEIQDVVLSVEFNGDGFLAANTYNVDVHNSLLIDVFPEQYNIVRIDFFGDGNMETMRFEREERDLRRVVRR